MTDADVLVVGGGPAGAACAILLARAGRRVILLEREAGPREKVCGEFLGGDALACLASLGLDVAALGGVAITQAGIARGATEACFALPFEARGLPRRLLDEALLQAAVAAGVILRCGVLVQAAARQGTVWRIVLTGGEALRAADLVLATGKRPLRGVTRASWNPAFVTAHGGSPLAALVDFLTGLNDEKAYFNIHTSAFGGGEIRGFLHQVAAVPEPASLALLAVGLISIAGARRSRD